MAELKTKPSKASVKKFIDAIEDEQKREDSRAVLALMKKVTGKPPKLWGTSIVGFGRYRYRYESGREGEWFLTGFSPRKQNLTLYIMSGFTQYGALLKKLGKFKTGQSCLYIKQLEDVHLPTLRKLIELSVKQKAKSG